jgi:hypothetical protein
VDQLLESIRRCELEQVERIISVIRNGASREEISAVVEQSLNESGQIGERDKEDEEEVDEASEELIGSLEGWAIIS